MRTSYDRQVLLEQTFPAPKGNRVLAAAVVIASINLVVSLISLILLIH